MKILVTGATGLVGKRLVTRLLAEGHEVTALGRNPRAGKELLELGARFLRLELREASRLMQTCAEQELVYHLAAAGPLTPLAAAEEIDLQATRHLLLGCKLHHVPRLVHLSSASVLLEAAGRREAREDAPLPARALEPHAAIRAAAEAEVRRAALRGQGTVILRPGAVIGPGRPAWLTELTRRVAAGTVWLAGEATLDLVAVDNLVDALHACQSAGPGIDGGTFHISNGEPCTLTDLVRRLGSKLGRSPRVLRYPERAAWGLLALREALPTVWQRPGARGVPRATLTLWTTSLTLDMARARSELGYRPRVSLDEALDGFVGAWKERRA